MNKNKIQGYLGLTLGVGIVAAVVTGRIKAYPTEWEWDWTIGQEWYSNYFYVWATAAVLYYPVIFGIKYYMEDKEPFDLGGAKSKGLINWIFWWETGLAIFSIVGAYYVVPNCMKPFLEGKGWVETVCGDSAYALDVPTSGFWACIFCMSKLFEFGDTLLVVLRKKRLILLQHYHHLATMLYCWAAVVTVGLGYNNATLPFAGMNLCVHSFMYTWYAATRTGWRSPRSIMMMVTVLQLVQMIGGIAIVVTTVFTDPGCPDPISNFALIMYGSYFFLFTRLFVQNYLIPKATAACHKVTSKCDKVKKSKKAE